MLFRKRRNLEEYELSQFPDEDLEDNGGNVSDPIRDSSDESSSVVFEYLAEHSQREGSKRDFNEDPNFQKVLQHYRGNQKADLKFWFRALISFLIILIFIGITSRMGKGKSNYAAVQIGGENRTLNPFSSRNSNVTLNRLLEGDFWPYESLLTWLNKRQISSDDADGYYLTREGLDYKVKHIKTEYSKTIFQDTTISYNGNQYEILKIMLNPGMSVEDDRTNYLVITNQQRLWRHLSLALYWIYDNHTKTYTPIYPKIEEDISDLVPLQFAEYSPKGDHILMGYKNDLYLMNLLSKKIERITNTGLSDILNGMCDWVYEEDVESTFKHFWWSEDQENIAFAMLNDTSVEDYELQYYIKAPPGDKLLTGKENTYGSGYYPNTVKLKYPRPGTRNPLVTILNYHVPLHKLSTVDINYTRIGEDFILYGASWIESRYLLLKLSDRESGLLETKLFDANMLSVQDIFFLNASELYNGWIEKLTEVAVLSSQGNRLFYIDKVVENDHTNLMLVEKSDTIKLKILTDFRDEEVVSRVFVDEIKKKIYWLTRSDQTQDNSLFCLTFSDEAYESFDMVRIPMNGTFDLDFSDNRKYVDLHFKGPEFPWRSILSIEKLNSLYEDKSKEESFNKLLETSSELLTGYSYEKRLQKINLPTRTHRVVKLKGEKSSEFVPINLVEILPPNFTADKKYPLLVYVYGGPGSCSATKDFDLDFQDVVSSELDAIVLIIDPRGTDGFGWNNKAYSKGRLGYWEARDVSKVTSDYIKKFKDVIDQERTAIWGWSYGGFTTLKTLEYDRGKTFKYGMAVAPVTNWLFYNSIYTERYMGLPLRNENYKSLSLIKEVENFKDVKRFLIMHGTADDNVHIQNLLWLLDKFNINNIENYDVHFFPDNDHSIYFHNSNKIVYDKLLHWLYDAFIGNFDNIK